MWCDNCLLLLPLRGGAIAWAVVIVVRDSFLNEINYVSHEAYSIGGGIFLLIRGQYFYFFLPEWQIYGGISLGIAATAGISMLALSNRSYIWIRVSKFLWPFVIVISAVRAIIMIVQLQRGKDKIIWECANGGQLWSDSVAAGVPDPGSPSGFCGVGFNSVNIALIISLLVDIVFQLYMFFLVWRYSKRLEHYSNMKGPYNGGYYT